MTKGEYRVGITFNPSSDTTVGKIKQVAADLINLIDGISMSDQDRTQFSEVARLKALAMTAIEEGAMWAVKAATKQPMEEN